LAEGSQHDYLHLFETFGVAKDVEHFETTDTRHHDIRDNKVGLFFFGKYKGLFAVHRGYNGIPFGLQTRFVNFA
jgi:hypothetical protein